MTIDEQVPARINKDVLPVSASQLTVTVILGHPSFDSLLWHSAPPPCADYSWRPKVGNSAAHSMPQPSAASMAVVSDRVCSGWRAPEPTTKKTGAGCLEGA